VEAGVQLGQVVAAGIGDTGGVAGGDMIEAYVAAVGDRLRGPRRLRADMLAEIRDAIQDASHDPAAEVGPDGKVEAGADLTAQAVADFGPAEEVAAGLQEVLAFVQARRTAWGLLAVLGVRHLLTLASAGAWSRWWHGIQPGAVYTLMSRTVDGLVVASLVLAVATVVVFGRAVRRVAPSLALVRIVAIGAPVALATTVGGGLLLTALAPAGRLGMVLAGTAWWLVPFALVLRSSWRCWQTARA
jgi:phosphoglycolate phosphatase-like HAD superfamily hydrolase